MVEPHVAEHIANDGGTLLYIEDNEANHQLMEKVLARYQHLQLITSTLGSSAVDLAIVHRPDLVLLDLNLPDISGEVVLARLRGEPSTQSIPVAILSADASAYRMQRLQQLGADAYLAKPFNLDDLLDLISACLGAGPAGQIARSVR